MIRRLTKTALCVLLGLILATTPCLAWADEENGLLNNAQESNVQETEIATQETDIEEDEATTDDESSAKSEQDLADVTTTTPNEADTPPIEADAPSGEADVTTSTDDEKPADADQSIPAEGEVTSKENDSVTAESASANAPTLTASAHVQNIGWKQADPGSNGTILVGTSGRGLRLEGMRLSVAGGSIEYKAHVQNVGWERTWSADGADSGSTGKSWRLEAVRIRLSDEMLADGWSVQYRAHAQDYGWLGWAADGEEAGTGGMGKRLEAVEVRIVRAGEGLPDGGGLPYRDCGLVASAHVQNIGWQEGKSGTSIMVGTSGRGLRMEALKIWRPFVDADGDVVYSAHVQNVGWQGERRNGEISGSVGRNRRVEAITVALTGELEERYDIWYRLHVQNVGWMGWASNGERAGTEGMSLRVESIQLVLLPKGGGEPSPDGQSTALPYLSPETSGSVSYSALTGGGWSDWASDGGTLGSSGGAAFKGLRASISGGVSGSISYAVHVADKGWLPYVTSDTEASWNNKDVQAVRMTLSGEAARFYNVWYRAYVQGIGWMGWAKNGQDAGSVGASKPIVALQVKVVSSGNPVSNTGFITDEPCLDGSWGQLYSNANSRQKRIVSAANSTPWPGPGLCAGWVESVYANAGLGSYNGNACDLYDSYCKSSNKRELKVGMIIAVRSHTRTEAGSIWGHVGIYVGDGWVMHSVTAGVKKVRLDYWIQYYGTSYTPKWGWLGNVSVG